MRLTRWLGRSGEGSTLYFAAWFTVMVVGLGVSFLLNWGSRWLIIHDRFRYAVDPLNSHVRTVWKDSRDIFWRAHESSWKEHRGDGEEWVRDGDYVESNPSGLRVVQGTYRAGKRVGLWSFWRDDGSADEERSGLYENDVRVQADPDLRSNDRLLHLQ